MLLLIRRSAYIYFGLTALWVAWRLMVFDRFWPVALLNTFTEYFFLPLPVLIVLVIVIKEWRLLAGLALPVAAFAVLFGEFFLPSFAPAPTGQPFTAMTFNVLWENKDVDAIAAAIEQNAPDIIGFEELHLNNFPGIEERLKDVYPYYTPQDDSLARGVGLFSRYPIESVEHFSLPPRDLTLHAILNVNGRRVHVFVVHLSPNNFFGYPANEWIGMAEERYTSRASETEQLRLLITKIDEPVVMLCDCNLSDTSQAYDTLRSFLTDSHREVGWGFGHTLIHPPQTFRTQRLDYVWHNSAFAATGINVGPAGGSDHLPVTARLVFTPP